MFFMDPNQDNGSRFKSWWKDLPVFSKFIFIITIFTSIISLFNKGLMLFVFCFNPLLVTQAFTFWQFFTFPYTCLSPISAAFSLCSYMSRCGKKERLLGTFRFFIYFVLQNFIIGLAFIPLFYFLYYIGAPADVYFLKLFITGLWPAIMLDMVLTYNEDGDEMTPFMCFPIQVKRKWYPWVFFLLFSVVFGVIFDLLAGLMTGYLYLYGMMKWSEISDSTGKKWESKLCCLLMAGSSYISVDDSGHELPGLRPVSVSSGRVVQQGSQYVPRPSAPVVPFTGSGYRLGGDEDESSGVSGKIGK